MADEYSSRWIRCAIPLPKHGRSRVISANPTMPAIEAPLFFDLKGAFYAGLFRCPDFHLHLTDPPSLLPLDVSKHAPSIRKRFPAKETGNSGWERRARGEAVHQLNKRGVQRARSVIAMTNAIADEIELLYARRAKVIRPGVEPGPGGVSRATASRARSASSRYRGWRAASASIGSSTRLPSLSAVANR